jgi:predicted membrane-bound spermidine synthase
LIAIDRQNKNNLLFLILSVAGSLKEQTPLRRKIKEFNYSGSCVTRVAEGADPDETQLFKKLCNAGVAEGADPAETQNYPFNSGSLKKQTPLRHNCIFNSQLSVPAGPAPGDPASKNRTNNYELKHFPNFTFMAKTTASDQRPTTHNQQPTANTYLLAAFIEGAVVLSVEILGAKILTPFFGNSLTVWTSIIGITITFLTLGYYAGGYLSRRQALHKVLSYMLSIAAILILIMQSWAPALFNSIADSSLYNSSIIASCLLLGPPMFALGTTSPVIIQQLTKQVHDSGKKAGLVYAVSTLGGICFIFLFGFLIIPNLGISIPLAALSLILFFFALYIFRSKTHIALAIVFVLFFLKFIQGQKTEDSTAISVPYMTEGLMGQLKVMDKLYPGNNTPFRHLMVNGVPETIITNNKEAISGWPYIHKIAILASMKRNNPDPRILLFGFGGGSAATEFNRMKMKTDVVEIDARLLDIAKKYFYFNDSLITYTVDDARHYMRTAKKQYDIISFDVFAGEVTPSYLFTTEGVRELKKLLKKDGMITIQFNELIDSSRTSAYRSICNTLLSEGYKVYYNLAPDEITDVMITASLNDIDFSLLDKKNMNSCCSVQPWTDAFLKDPMTRFDKLSPNGVILTDDKPMLDILNAETLKKWREWVITTYTLPQLKEEQKIFK